MKYLVASLIILCVLYMVLRSLVWAGHLMLWAAHVAFPAIVLLGLVALYISLSRRRS